MLNLERVKMEYCVEQLSRAYRQTYSNMEQELGNVIIWSSHLALEIIANSDALYHNVEHTIMVALAGQSILEGKHLSEGGVSPRDWAHFVIALLCHDIGYVKGICRDDIGDTISTGVDGQKVTVTPGGTDAALSPYHVDRSKKFVQDRFGKGMLAEGFIDAELLTSYIEMTRFPVPDERCTKTPKDTMGSCGRPISSVNSATPTASKSVRRFSMNSRNSASTGSSGTRRPGICGKTTPSFTGTMSTCIFKMPCTTCASPRTANSGLPTCRQMSSARTMDAACKVAEVLPYFLG